MQPVLHKFNSWNILLAQICFDSWRGRFPVRQTHGKITPCNSSFPVDSPIRIIRFASFWTFTSLMFCGEKFNRSQKVCIGSADWINFWLPKTSSMIGGRPVGVHGSQDNSHNSGHTTPFSCRSVTKSSLSCCMMFRFMIVWRFSMNISLLEGVEAAAELDVIFHGHNLSVEDRVLTLLDTHTKTWFLMLKGWHVKQRHLLL